MLRIHKLTPKQSNGAAYYTDLASKDLTAYYAGMGEAPVRRSDRPLTANLEIINYLD